MKYSAPVLPALLGAIMLASAAPPLRAADDKDGPVITSPDEAASNPDFKIQGEYTGSLATDEGEQKVGVQIIALGDGKFRAVGYKGGLPGTGYDKEHETNTVEGEAGEDGTVTFAKPDSEMTGVADGETLEVMVGTQTIGTLAKTHRESPTLGQKAPDGAVVLFDGSSADGWKDGRMAEDGLLMQGATSLETFGDHTLHLEFRLPFKPNARGQGRGNSGVYLHAKHEIQILDSFGLTGESNECGGIYGVAAPATNMCFPPLAWQSYDIEFTAAKLDADGNKTANAKMTVSHNGVKIHDNVEVPDPTTAAPSTNNSPEGPVFLQDHGNPVVFRNIWALKK